MTNILKKVCWSSAVLGLALATVILPTGAAAQDRDQQDQQDDPPSRVARIVYIEGAVSFQPGRKRLGRRSASSSALLLLQRLSRRHRLNASNRKQRYLRRKNSKRNGGSGNRSLQVSRGSASKGNSTGRLEHAKLD
jgi:hypothetical protein